MQAIDALCQLLGTPDSPLVTVKLDVASREGAEAIASALPAASTSLRHLVLGGSVSEDVLTYVTAAVAAGGGSSSASTPRWSSQQQAAGSGSGAGTPPSLLQQLHGGAAASPRAALSSPRVSRARHGSCSPAASAAGVAAAGRASSASPRTPLYTALLSSSPLSSPRPSSRGGFRCVGRQSLGSGKAPGALQQHGARSLTSSPHLLAGGSSPSPLQLRASGTSSSGGVLGRRTLARTSSSQARRAASLEPLGPGFVGLSGGGAANRAAEAFRRHDADSAGHLDALGMMAALDDLGMLNGMRARQLGASCDEQGPGGVGAGLCVGAPPQRDDGSVA